MPSSKDNEVNIFGQTYHIRGATDAERTRAAARLVDQQMNAIASEVQYSESFRIAVLAALHLADEYLTLRKEHEQLRRQVDETSSRIESLLEKSDKDQDAPVSLYSAAD